MARMHAKRIIDNEAAQDPKSERNGRKVGMGKDTRAKKQKEEKEIGQER